jgi:hypothetical protein
LSQLAHECVVAFISLRSELVAREPGDRANPLEVLAKLVDGLVPIGIPLLEELQRFVDLLACDPAEAGIGALALFSL